MIECFDKIGSEELRDKFKTLIKGKPENEHLRIAKKLVLDEHEALHKENEAFKKKVDKKYKQKQYVGQPDKTAEVEKIKSEYQTKIDEAKVVKKEEVKKVESKSILNQEKDLKGNKKDVWMIPVSNESAKIDSLRKQAIDLALQEDIEGNENRFKQAINDGKMTANDAKKIIESAGLEVPKDIIELAKEENKPTPNEKTETTKVPDTEKKASVTDEGTHKVIEPTEKGESKVPEFEVLKKKIPVAQTIDGTNAHEVTTTKEIATILGVSTPKAFEIMEKLEKEGLAYKYGYRTKGGWEDVSNSSLKSHSLGWELNSKSEPKPIPSEKVKEAEPTTETKKDIGTKARELASKLESGEKSVLPSWMKAKLPPGTKLSGIDIDKAYANALRTFADIHDATKNFAKAIEEGFKHIKEWFKENNIDIDEVEMKANFEKEVGEKGPQFESVRKEKLKEIEGVKEMFEKRIPKKWSEVYKSALENVQKMYPKKSLYEAMKARVNELVLRLNNKELFNPTSEDIAVFTTFRAETQKRINEVEGQDSNDSIVRQAANMELDNLQQDLMNISRVTNPEGEAGRAFGMHQSEAMLDANYGLKIRRMELMKSKGDEKLTPEEEQWVKDKWEQEKEIMKQEAAVREQGMKEDFDNKIAELQKEYEEKLKQKGKNIPQNRTTRDRTLRQKGKDIADQIRKLKIQKGDIAIDVTFGLRNLAIEGVAQLVEKGATIADAIKEVLKDVKYKGISENELINHIVDGLNNKKDKKEQLDKIKDFAQDNGITDITNDMVTQNLIRDYINSHIGEVDKSEVFETAFKDLKNILPNVTKEKMVEAYLKKGDFKQPTKKQLEGGIREQQNELMRIARAELTADQQQKIKLDLSKQNAIRKGKELKRKLADEEFEQPAPIGLKKSDAELIRLKKEQSIIEEAYRKKQREFQEKNKGWIERGADFARSLYVAILIGAPKTLAKVASMSLARPASEAASKLTFGKVFSKFFPGISKVAERGGEGSSVKSIQKGFEAYFRQMGDKKMEQMYDNANKEFNDASKAYYDYKDSANPDPKKLERLKTNMNNKLIKVQGSFIYKFIGGSSLKDALKALVNRSNEIEKQFGKVEGESIKEGNWLDKTNYILGFIGRSHSAAKTFSGRFSFAAGFMARLEGAVKNGEDISSPDKVLEIAHESYLDWERGKYQQENAVTRWWNKHVVNKTVDPEHPEWENIYKAISTAAKFDVAITRVPVNIIHEAVMEYTFGAFRALRMAAKTNLEVRKQLKDEGILPDNPEFKAALKEKINQMDAKQAATIVRAFRKGGLGVGLYATALILGSIHFGIFPHLGQKKKKEEKDLKPEELNPGQIMVGDTKLGEVTSGIIEHIPALWPTFMGLGMAQAYQDQIDKGKSSRESVQAAIYTHLKVVEGNIPQTKIISPTEIGETMAQSVEKKAEDSGLIDKEEYKGFTKDQLESPVLQWGKEKGIKISAPTKKYTDNGEEKIMTEEQYDKYTVNRAKRIAHDLELLKKNGLVSGKKDDESIQEEARKVIKKAGEDAKSEVLKIKQQLQPLDAIKNYRPLPVHPLR